MTGDGDEREKKTFAELDKLRRRPRSEREDRPRGKRAQEEAVRQTRQALASANALFSQHPGGARGEAHRKAIQAAHGTPGLAAACHAYVSELGMPESADLLSIFLDVHERTLRVQTLEALERLAHDGRLAMRAGLKSQLRVLAQDPDDEIAELAEALLARGA